MTQVVDDVRVSDIFAFTLALALALRVSLPVSLLSAPRLGGSINLRRERFTFLLLLLLLKVKQPVFICVHEMQ